MLLKCCLLQRDIALRRHAIFSIFVSILRFGLYMSYLCNLFAIIIFIFITVNHITSLIQTNLIFGRVYQNFSLRGLLSFHLFFCKYRSGVAYKSVAYKKNGVVCKRTLS